MSEKDLTDKIKKVTEEDEKVISNETSIINTDEITEKTNGEDLAKPNIKTPIELEKTFEKNVTTEVETDESEKDTGVFSTLLSVIGNVIFSLFLILLMAVVALNVASLVNGNDFSIFNRRFYIVGEDTMYPIIKENDAIIVEEKKIHEIEDGDLVVYETIDGEVVTGWVTSLLDKDRFEIKKDINSSDSIVVDGIAVIGVASLRIQNMGDFIEFISKPASLVLILAVGIVIYMLVWFVSKPKKRLNY